MENKDSKLLEILQQEKFLAFFDFCKIGESGESELDGLCKVAIPQNVENIDYICFTFIFDTPNEASKMLAKRIMAKLTTEAFRKAEPSVYAVTSVPAIMRQAENYIHQLDVIFKDKVNEAPQEHNQQTRLYNPQRRGAWTPKSPVVGRIRSPRAYGGGKGELVGAYQGVFGN